MVEPAWKENTPVVEDGWLQYGETFFGLLIGGSAFAKQCTIINKEDLKFYYNPDTYSLWVTSDKPVQIENLATGYRISYWMQDFNYNLASEVFYNSGYMQFTALNPNTDKVKKTWAKNRQAAYYGSINHFMRSVFASNVAAEGFEIRTLERVRKPEPGQGGRSTDI